MIQHIKTYKTPLILVLALFAFHLFQKDFQNPYARPIAGDAQAYYAYLPATFIYQDLTYEFIPQINAKYYPESHQKSFLKPAGEGKVNKTFPGVAVLYLPFFLIAHALALLFDLPADGYSTIYQVCFDIGLWVYLYFGLVFGIRLLKKVGVSGRMSTVAICGVLVATNMIFYSVYDQSVTHIYNFFMINAMLFYLIDFREKQSFKSIGIVLFLLALIAITRPTNILVLGLIFFFIPDLSFYKSTFNYCIKPKNLSYLLPITGVVLMLPFIFWKLQTGNWVVYSYGDEGFDFAHPHFFDFLFSYLKGWLIYTPFALLILLIGLPILFKKSKKRFSIALAFYLVSIYVFSSWWCWYYGAGMGQRVMIDHYILLAFLLVLVLEKIRTTQLFKWSFYGIGILCITLNFAQAYQIRHGILTGGSATEEQYWDNFMSFEKQARVYAHDHWQLEQSMALSLQTKSTEVVKGNSYLVENNWCIQVSDYEKYSAVLDLGIENAREGSKIVVRFEARARDIIEETRVVVDLGGERQVFGLSHYLKQDEWIRVEFLMDVQKMIELPVLLYFWNGGSAEKAEFKNMRIEHYFSASYL